MTILIAVSTLVLAAAAQAKRPTINPQRQQVVNQLNRALDPYPMFGTGKELEAAGWKHGVNPFFIAAIAGTESSFGQNGCYPNRRNSFGLSSCGSGWHVPWFSTWAAAYDFMARFLSSRWPHAQTPWQFYGYAADSQAWGTKTAYWMRRLGSRSTSVRYGVNR